MYICYTCVSNATYPGAIGLGNNMYLPALQTISALNTLSCQGTETSLKDCTYDMTFDVRCEIASVVCQGGFELDNIIMSLCY